MAVPTELFLYYYFKLIVKFIPLYNTENCRNVTDENNFLSCGEIFYLPIYFSVSVLVYSNTNVNFDCSESYLTKNHDCVRKEII